MYYTYEYKNKCLKLYKQKKCPATPIGVKLDSLHNQIRQ